MTRDFSKVTRKEIDASPNMTDRERFVYIAMCIIFNPVCRGLDKKRKDEILHHFANEFCPSFTAGDMWRIMQEIEKNQHFVVEELDKVLTKEEKTAVTSAFQELGDPDKIADLVDKIKTKNENR